MLYIEKEGLPLEVDEKIIKLSKSKEWKMISPTDTVAIRDYFDDVFPKEDVKKILIHEQHGICAYCMRRICNDNRTRVEHLIPLSRDKESAIKYSNLLGVCDGGEKTPGIRGRVLCCDAQKKEKEITISPYDRVQMSRIAYNADGVMFTKPRDEELEKDINLVLQLNGIKNQDGTIRDTATEVVKGRRDTYERARRIMKTMNSKGKCTSAKLEELINRLKNKEEYDEYVGVMLYYFQKKLNSLIRQGL